MNWNAITGFCFTYAMPDGAWLEDADGNREWVSGVKITAIKGGEWYMRHIRKHGQLTGCWIKASD